MAKKGAGAAHAAGPHDELPAIRGTIDSWDRVGHATSRPPRDYAAIEAAVDKLTKRVKTRKVTVTETVTEYVDADGAVEVHTPVPAQVDAVRVDDSAEAAAPAKLGFFARRKAAKQAKAAADAPRLESVEAAPAPRAAAAPRDDDAWDPGARPVAPAKPLQSKAAKRSAKKAGKKR